MRGTGDADREPLDLIEIAAELVKEFPGMTQEAIAELDRWWIAFVYFTRRDKYGQLIVRPKGTKRRQLISRDSWIKSAERNWGFPTWFAERKYDAMTEAKAQTMASPQEEPIIVSAVTRTVKHG